MPRDTEIVVLSIVQRIVGASRFDEIFAQLTRAHGAIVLMFHSIAGEEQVQWIHPAVRWPAAIFQRQVEFLRKHRRVVSMSELAEAIVAGKQLPRGTVAITFDDGYLDTLRIAAPILAAAGLPATVYLPSAYIEGAKPQWIDELWVAFQRRRSNRVVTDVGTWNISNEKASRQAFAQISRLLLEARFADRQFLLTQIRESLGARDEMPQLTMNWSQVRELMHQYPAFEIGGHTVGHVDLRRRAAGEARAEVSTCADDIERETGSRPRHFSFPYGRWSEQTRRIVQEVGFATAVSDGNRVLINEHSDRWALSRVEGHAGVSRLKFLTSGAYPKMPWVSRS